MSTDGERPAGSAVDEATTLRERAATLVDLAARTRVLVYGSLPPHGRDLDVLARDTDHDRIARTLAAEGFERRGATWARFDGCTAVAVELRHADTWQLPAAELGRLFGEAVPLRGRTTLVEPSAHHRLLLMAARVAATGQLDAERRATVDAALRRDPLAWSRARQRAAAWHVPRALAVLAALHARRRPGPGRRAAAVAEMMRADGMHPMPAWLRAWRMVVAPTIGRRGAIIALSGLDGSGKSSQAEALRRALEAVGHPAAVEWSRIAFDPALEVVAAPVKAAIARFGAGGPAATSSIEAASGQVTRRGVLVESLWAVVTALVDVRARRALVRRHVRRGRAVICDRYLLDTLVHLHERFAGLPLSLAVHLCRALSPSPTHAWLLRVPAETAHARKAQEFDVTRLRRHADLYDRLCRAAGVEAIDGTRPRGELCARIALQTWSAVAAPRRARWRTPAGS